MNLLYRIKVVDEHGVFVRYASEGEMMNLKPKADGSGVERMILLPAAGIFGGWQDVSDTHNVEWWFTWHEDKVFYENDIIARRYGNPEVVLRKIAKSNSPRCEYFCAKYISGDTISKHDIGMSVLNIYYSVIGNVNENPELLEEK